MRLFREIFGRIWALWGMISFVTTFLIIFIPSQLTWLIPEPLGQRIFIGIARMWMNVWLLMVGCPFKVKGREKFEKGKTYVVTCNHNSLMDVPLTAPFTPGGNKTIAKSSFTKIPLFGFFYMKGSILVDRNSEKSRRESFDKMRDVLANGMHMCIYPEGTRNRSAEPMKKFHDGAFRLAVITKHDVIPAVVFNTKKALPVNKTFFFWPTKLEMHFLDPVLVEGKTAEQVKMEVFEKMRDHYVSSLLRP